MADEFEIVEHPHIMSFKAFIVKLVYRNLHMHSDFEICLILKGSVLVNLISGSFVLSQNDFAIFNPCQLHELRSKSSDSLILSLQISPNFCKSYFPSISNLEFNTPQLNQYLPETVNKLILNEITEIGYHYFNKESGYQLICLGLLNILFYQLINHAPYHLVSDEEKIKRTNRLNRITNYIDENFSSKLLLSDIADLENLSLTYLSHFFKDNFNTTFQNYLMNIRFEKAKQLIVQTEEKLIDICLESGFSDIRYLNRMFFKQYGCTPKEYRKKINSHNDIAASINSLCIQKFFDEKSSLKILMELNTNRE